MAITLFHLLTIIAITTGSPLTPKCYGAECLQDILIVLNSQSTDVIEQTKQLVFINNRLDRLEQSLTQHDSGLLDSISDAVGGLSKIIELLTIAIILYGIFKTERVWKFGMFLIGCIPFLAMRCCLSPTNESNHMNDRSLDALSADLVLYQRGSSAAMQQ